MKCGETGLGFLQIPSTRRGTPVDGGGAMGRQQAELDFDHVGGFDQSRLAEVVV